MTSNLGMRELSNQAAKIGFADKEEKLDQKAHLEKEYDRVKDGVMEEMKKEFRPEFLNRIDKIIVFRPLGFEELKKITQLQVSQLQTRLLEQNITLKISAPVIKFISEKSFDPAQGARFVRKNIQQLLEDPLAEKIISGRALDGLKISAELKNGAIVFSLHKLEKLPVLA
jgi:ATP-dependent Clp protease ATP-binding subunit ClpC